MASISTADLQNLELLAGFQPEELEQFCAQCTLHEFATNDVVFAPGDTSRALHIILSGRIEIDLVGRLENTALAELSPGDVFGETTFFHAAQHNSTALCLEPTRIAKFAYETYEQLLKSNSAMAYHLGANAAHILAARLQQTDLWIRDVLDQDEEHHRRDLREKYHSTFHPTFTTPTGFVGLGVNW